MTAAALRVVDGETADLVAPRCQVRVAGQIVKATLTSAEAAELFGVSAQQMQTLARQPDAPVAPIRFGSRFRWPTLKLAEVLGLPADLVLDGDEVTLP